MTEAPGMILTAQDYWSALLKYVPHNVTDGNVTDGRGLYNKRVYRQTHTHTHTHTQTNRNTHTHTFIVSCGVSYFHKLVLAVSKTAFSGYTKVTNTSTLKILTMDRNLFTQMKILIFVAPLMKSF